MKAIKEPANRMTDGRAPSSDDALLSRPSLHLLTINEAARELRCSRARLCNILSGRVVGLPPLPVFHLGRKTFIRQTQLYLWVRTLEAMEREQSYATGLFGMRDDELEFIAGA